MQDTYLLTHPGVKKKILAGGTGLLPHFPTGTKLVFHFQTLLDNVERMVIDDSRLAKRPAEIFVGKMFKMEVWETLLTSMRVGEVAEFWCDAIHTGLYPIVSKGMRLIAQGRDPLEGQRHMCGMGNMLHYHSTGFPELDELLRNPQPLIFIMELLQVGDPLSYHRESWMMEKDEKLEAVPTLHMQGNALVRQREFMEAASKYKEAVLLLKTVQSREMPGDVDYINLGGMIVPLELNYCQCMLELEEYYEVIEHASKLLEKHKDCVKGFYKRAKAHAAVWNEKEARRDFNQVVILDATLAGLVHRELKALSERIKEKHWEEREKYWKILEHKDVLAQEDEGEDGGGKRKAETEKVEEVQGVCTGNALEEQDVCTGNALEEQGVCTGNALEEQGVCTGNALEVQGVCTGNALEVQDVYTGNGLEVQGVCTGNALELQGVCTGNGLEVQDVCTGNALEVQGVCTGNALEVQGVCTGNALEVQGVCTGNALEVQGVCTGNALEVQDICTGYGLEVQDICTGNALEVQGVCTGNALEVQGVCTGNALEACRAETACEEQPKGEGRHPETLPGTCSASAQRQEMDWQQMLRMVMFLKDEGNFLLKETRFKEASEKFKEAIEYINILQDKVDRTSEDWESLEKVRLPLTLNLSQCLLELQQYQQVVELNSKLLRIHKGNVKAVYQRARAHSALCHEDEARRDLVTVERLEPGLKPAVRKELKTLGEHVRAAHAGQKKAYRDVTREKWGPGGTEANAAAWSTSVTFARVAVATGRADDEKKSAEEAKKVHVARQTGKVQCQSAATQGNLSVHPDTGNSAEPANESK